MLFVKSAERGFNVVTVNNYRDHLIFALSQQQIHHQLPQGPKTAGLTQSCLNKVNLKPLFFCAIVSVDNIKLGPITFIILQ